MKLYYTPGTSAFRCRWMLEELGTPYELIDLNLGRGEHKQPDYLKVHPLGSVPALTDGDANFIESAAIVMHLADKDPEQRFTPPIGTANRGHYYQWILFAMTNLYQAVHTPYLRHLFHHETATRDHQTALAPPPRRHRRPPARPTLPARRTIHRRRHRLRRHARVGRSLRHAARPRTPDRIPRPPPGPPGLPARRGGVTLAGPQRRHRNRTHEPNLTAQRHRDRCVYDA